LMNRSVFATALALAVSLAGTGTALAIPDLTVAKQGRKAAKVGTEIRYTIRIKNIGDEVSDGVALTDDLPGEACPPPEDEGPPPPCEPPVAFVSAEPSQGECFGEAEGFVTCSLDNLGPRETITVEVVLISREPGVFTNSAFVGANNEIDYSDNEDSVTTRVRARR
jgi:uncharacterized repeat protein (TIGR01451 family)